MEKELFKHCVIFRNAIERTDKRKLFLTLQNFPHGSCGDAVLLLGHYLKNNDFGKIDYMLGERETETNDGFRSHAWLQRESLVIDITADQFEDFKEPVFVQSDSQWHEEFNG